MKKYVYWIFLILWTSLTFLIGNYARITFNTGLLIFLLIVVPLQLIGNFFANKFIKATR